MRFRVGLVALALVLTACGSTSSAAVVQTPSASAASSPRLSASPSQTSMPSAYPGLWPRVAAIAYDSTRNQVVIFGGSGTGLYAGDTWTFDGHLWTQRHPASNPAARRGAALVEDPSMHAVLLFGGIGGGGELNDTWAWDGTNWTRLAPAHSPSPRAGAAATYDSVRHVVLLFGGSDLADTWTWNGQDWTQASPAKSPTPRMYGRMAVHEPTGKVILYGGFQHEDTWAWDGTTWAQLLTNNTPPAEVKATPTNGQMAYDAARHVVIFLDPTWPPDAKTSDDVTMDTWVFDGADWRKLAPAHPPSARDGYGLTYDSSRSITVLAGGWAIGKADAQTTWAWDGTDWSTIG